MSPLAVFGVASAVAGLVAWSVVRRWPRLDPSSPAAMVHGPADAIRHHAGVRRFLRDRLAPGPATGLALTVAAAVIVAGAAAFGVLVLLVRGEAGASSLDVEVAQWASRSATDLSTSVLRVVTELGASRVLVPLALVVALVEHRRVPSRATVGFLVLIVLGQNLLSNLTKWLVDRARPDIDPLAGFGGPSFPSGHTTAAAACFAAFALVLGRRRPLPVKAALAGGAVAIGVAVGATRVLLGVHWLTDVLGGLALGWAWFCVGSLVFGGRLLRFGAPLEAAVRAPEPEAAEPGTGMELGDRSRP